MSNNTWDNLFDDEEGEAEENNETSEVRYYIVTHTAISHTELLIIDCDACISAVLRSPQTLSPTQQFPYWMTKDSIVFLIDASPAMFVETDEGETPFECAVRCAINTLTDKIISSDSDLVAVCFYGTVRNA